MTDFSRWNRRTLNSFACEATHKMLRQEKRIGQLEATMRRMVAAVENNHCSGESQFAIGINAACDNHAVGLMAIMDEVGVPCSLGDSPLSI